MFVILVMPPKTVRNDYTDPQGARQQVFFSPSFIKEGLLTNENHGVEPWDGEVEFKDRQVVFASNEEYAKYAAVRMAETHPGRDVQVLQALWSCSTNKPEAVIKQVTKDGVLPL